MTKRTVLVVDDQIVNRKILGRILENEYEVMKAENGREALELLHANPEISAVLLDIVMPVMDGYEVLKSMREDPVLSKIPVIVSSQKDGDEAEVKALSLGAYDFIAKPYKSDIIRHRLGNMIKFRETASMVNKAERDELTGLYNKQFFFSKVTDQLEKYPDKAFDILCVGVERFKLINDVYGEEEGNRVLCHIGAVLREEFHEIDICGRFSGDEFYALIIHQNQQEETRMADCYRKVNEYPIDMEIKIHCGIYQIHGKDMPINAMCDRAELAADSNRGKYDQIFDYYDDSLRQKMLDEQFITSHMYEALDQHQFQVYYQPKYDLNSEMIAGAEALVRWIHPEKGFLSPGEFIPLFERNGFITQLDQYVWEAACRDMRKWMDMGYPPLAISVNVSRADIYNAKLSEILLGLVAKYQIPIRYLHLEITESAYTDNPDQIITVVNRFRELGFIIEMDDFGSGYSSLNMLARMPIDVLKLDMKFVQMESENKSGKGILSFVISLAKWLDLAVVAEGVETAEQIASLRSMDCNYVQGFYFAKPMPEPDFMKLIASSHTTEMVSASQMMQTYVEEEKKHLPDAKKRDMLIVDDIEVNRAVLASIFEENYNIIEKENGQEAWAFLTLEGEHVDVVLLDLLMPVMDGFQLLKKIRDTREMDDMAVIITSQGDADSEQRALELKADDFISKPYRPDIIRHRVHNVVNSFKYQHLQEINLSALYLDQLKESKDSMTIEERVRLYVEAQKPHFDIVRLVDPIETLVYDSADEEPCEHRFCFSVWGKNSRCNNCISLKAYESKSRSCKLEYSNNNLFFVISEYVPYGETGAVVEMVTKLDSDYVDNIFQRDLLYRNIDAIHQQLEVDALTGIYNRRHIEKYLPVYLEHAKRHGCNIGIAMVDIDFFKQLNDKHGHLAGDEVLKRVATVLQSNIAISKGDFAARFGGDEFMVVCRDIPERIFVQRLKGMLKIVSMISSEEKMTVDISIGGINSREEPQLSMQELIKRADERLYQAKKAGKARVVIK